MIEIAMTLAMASKESAKAIAIWQWTEQKGQL
jgi:hypothetical protein